MPNSVLDLTSVSEFDLATVFFTWTLRMVLDKWDRQVEKCLED